MQKWVDFAEFLSLLLFDEARPEGRFRSSTVQLSMQLRIDLVPNLGTVSCNFQPSGPMEWATHSATLSTPHSPSDAVQTIVVRRFHQQLTVTHRPVERHRKCRTRQVAPPTVLTQQHGLVPPRQVPKTSS